MDLLTTTRVAKISHADDPLRHYLLEVRDIVLFCFFFLRACTEIESPGSREEPSEHVVYYTGAPAQYPFTHKIRLDGIGLDH